MPSDPHVFDELKLPFVFVPHGAPEPTEWMARYPDYIKLPATFVPRGSSNGGADPTFDSPPPGQRGTVDGLAPPPDPAAAWRPAGSAMSNTTPAGTSETADRAWSSGDPIPAFLAADAGLATAASGYAPGRGNGAPPDVYAGTDLPHHAGPLRRASGEVQTVASQGNQSHDT